MAAAVGLVIGFFCVRLRGIYFSILTLAFGQLIFVIIYKWHDFTGGDDGIQGVFPPGILKSPVAYYYFILFVFILAAFILWRIIQSPFGHTLRAMRENSERTEFLGNPHSPIPAHGLCDRCRLHRACRGPLGPLLPIRCPIFPDVGEIRRTGHGNDPGWVCPVFRSGLGDLYHHLHPCLPPQLHPLLAHHYGDHHSHHHLCVAGWDLGLCSGEIEAEARKKESEIRVRSP